MEYACKVLQYPKVFSYTTVRNIPTQKIAEKIGMQFYNLWGALYVYGDAGYTELARCPESQAELGTFHLISGYLKITDGNIIITGYIFSGKAFNNAKKALGRSRQLLLAHIKDVNINPDRGINI